MKVLSTIRGYGLAMICCGIALTVAWPIDAPASCFLLAVIVSTLFGGLGPGLFGNSPVLEAVLEQVERVAPTISTVIIQGETGTGKELIAHAIYNLNSAYRRSERRRHETWLEAHHADPQDAEAADFPARPTEH
jgi:hypothetical protein